MDGLAIRVPTPNVSLVDVVVEMEKNATKDEVNAALKDAANGKLKGILEYCEEPLVSKDFNGSSASSIVDSLITQVLDGNFAKIMAWYDNEWGYSCRVVDLALYIIEKGL
jgi:glyceraldehyde 3-phosphate dehydrogenase